MGELVNMCENSFRFLKARFRIFGNQLLLHNKSELPFAWWSYGKDIRPGLASSLPISHHCLHVHCHKYSSCRDVCDGTGVLTFLRRIVPALSLSGGTSCPT